ncbi:MAG: alpha-hydroxy-acid oxidizing protein [Ruminococcaceae bacterium]|nr:alpha-hydroxy-acid oxidizing protein [Oscillospiraceae bacterium]
MQMPVRPGDASKITREYLESILIEQRLIDSVTPDLTMELFGKLFRTPVMMPAFSHLHLFLRDRADGMTEYARAAKALGAVNWVGMSENEEFCRIMEVGAPTVRIMKPLADRQKLKDQIACAEDLGALAVGIDIDHVFTKGGKFDVVHGEKMSKYSMDDVADLVQSTRLPFIMKGILSVQDARKSAECGVGGIVVSHHHGRLSYAVPPVMILPRILEAAEGKMKVFVDCSMDTGADAYKALALGADAVAVGRALMQPLGKDGAQGVIDYVTGMNDELARLMACTGVKDLKNFDPSVLWLNGKPITE